MPSEKPEDQIELLRGEIVDLEHELESAEMREEEASLEAESRGVDDMPKTICKAVDAPFYIHEIRGVCYMTWVSEEDVEEAKDFKLCKERQRLGWIAYIKQASGVDVAFQRIAG